MDSFELNKIGGALTGALMMFMLIGWFSDLLFYPGGHGYGKEPKNYYASASATDDKTPKEEPVVDMVALIASATPDSGEKVFRKCKSCHKVEKGAGHGQGPALYGVMGRQIAAPADFKFSDALKGKGVAWDWESMNGFLEKPKQWAPGTRMNFAGLKKPEDRAKLMVYLNAQSDAPIALPAVEAVQ